jgi:hypothetical protein
MVKGQTKQETSLRQVASSKEALFATFYMLGSCLDYSSALKIEATCSSESSVDFQQTTRRYVLFRTTAVRTSNPTLISIPDEKKVYVSMLTRDGLNFRVFVR